MSTSPTPDQVLDHLPDGSPIALRAELDAAIRAVDRLLGRCDEPR